MENFMDPGRPDMGGMAMNQDKRHSQHAIASNEAQSYVGATGVKTAGEVEAAGIIADAQAGVAQAQGQASMMEGIGGIASSALGAFGGGGGLGGGGGSAINYSGLDSGVIGQLGGSWTGY
jgi:hypothetical protein